MEREELGKWRVVKGRLLSGKSNFLNMENFRTPKHLSVERPVDFADLVGRSALM